MPLNESHYIYVLMELRSCKGDHQKPEVNTAIYTKDIAFCLLLHM